MTPVRRTRSLVILVVVLAVALIVGWWIASPWWTLRSLQTAARAGDAAGVVELVDLPALRDDLKGEVMASLAAEAQRTGDPAARVGAALGGALVGPMIDGLVTPAMLATAFAARAGTPKTARSVPSRVFDVGEAPTTERVGLSEFRLVPTGAAGGALVFRRRGLGWRLVGVDLPGR